MKKRKSLLRKALSLTLLMILAITSTISVSASQGGDRGHTVSFTKVDEQWNKLEGAEFTLVKEGESFSATSDSCGKVEFRNVPDGVYTLKETVAPVGYELSAETEEITVGRDSSGRGFATFSKDNNKSKYDDGIKFFVNTAKLDISKEVDKAVAKPGEEILYTIDVVNNSRSTFRDVSVLDKISEYLTEVELVDPILKENDGLEDSVQERCYNETNIQIVDNVLSGSIGKIGSGDSFTITFKGKVKADVANGTVITNSALIDEKETNKTETEVKYEVISANKAVSATEAYRGDTITYTINVKNTGLAASEQVVIEDTISKGLTDVKVNNNGYLKDEKITWTIPSIEAGKTVSVSFSAKVDSAETIKNVSYVNGVPTNEVSTTIKAVVKSAVEVVKTSAVKTSAVKTGDNNLIALWSLLAGVSAIGVVVNRKFKKCSQK